MSPEVLNKEKYHKKQAHQSCTAPNGKEKEAIFIQVTQSGNEKCRRDLKFAERKAAPKSRPAIQGRKKKKKIPSQGERASEVA